MFLSYKHVMWLPSVESLLQSEWIRSTMWLVCSLAVKERERGWGTEMERMSIFYIVYMIYKEEERVAETQQIAKRTGRDGKCTCVYY